MLYLDSSALAKRYFLERGSKQLRERLNRGDRVFTSELSFAEVHAAIARKYHERGISRKAYLRLRRIFLEDWLLALNRVEITVNTMTAIPDLLERYQLKGADAVHLAAAIWLRDVLTVGVSAAGDDATLEFAVADARLSQTAARCGLRVFNPESED